MSRHRRQRFALAASKDDRSIRLAAGEPLASAARPENLDALVTPCSSEPEMRDRLVGGRVAVGTKEGSSSHLAVRFDGDDRAEGLERTLERLHLQPAAALGRRVVSEDANSSREVARDQVDVAVPIEVSERERSIEPRHRAERARLRGDFGETAVPDAAEDLPGLLASRSGSSGRITAYICRGTSCLAPITTMDALAAEL